MSYRKDPNYLFDRLKSVNEFARDLRQEGWAVQLKLSDDGERVWPTLHTSNLCEPDAPKE